MGTEPARRRPPTAHWRRAVAALAVVTCLGLPPAAGAFDTGPHFDITRDSLAAEGFNDRAIRTTQVSNWFVDLYENADSIPFSGHAGTFKSLVGGVGPDAPLVALTRWPDAVVESADLTHFDATGGGYSGAAAITAEWARLQRAVGALAREARDRDDPVQLLSVLGISSHAVQDFYSHTNWLEPGGIVGGEGPDWAGNGFGATPTWFDVPAAVRDAERLYAGGSTGIGRDHGSWKADGNRNLNRSNAKDWPGRPLYTEAHLAAYFATRQWVQAIRAHVADEAFWARAARLGSEPWLLGKDERGALNISLASGHWQGQGEACNPSLSTLSCGARNGPGGNLIDLRGAVIDYFRPVLVKSDARARFERNITRVRDPGAEGPEFPVPSSRPMQLATRFVRLQITSWREIDNLDRPGEADLFLRARIGSQRYVSGVVNSRDSFSFRPPHAPYAFLRSVPRGLSVGTPLTSIRVRVRTADVRFAGTDDDVYLRISPTRRFRIDKRLYDDFERGDDDVYSVPIDGALADGLGVGDVKFVQIEKSRDGAGGGWRLGGVTVWVNDRPVVRADRVDRWLEDDRRAWRAPGFRATDPRGAALPVFMQLWEMDAPIRGDHDHTDTHPWAGRRDTAVPYAPGAVRRGRATGGRRFGGRWGDGPRARFDWRLTTVDPVVGTVVPSAPQPPPPDPAPGPGPGGTPPPPPPPPDLRISAFTLTEGFTVTNSGAGPAGPSVVAVAFAGTFPVPALAAGASFTQAAPQGCFEGATYSATADAAGQVAESDETNNVATIGPVFC